MEELIAEKTEIEAEVNPLIVAAQALTVYDEPSYGAAMDMGKACAIRIKMVEDKLGPAKRKTYDAYQEVLKLMKSFIEPLEAAKKLISGRAYAWKKAEEDRRRREAEEARRKAEEKAALRQKAEEDARLAAAEELEKQGRATEAEQVLTAPIVVKAAVPLPGAPPAIKVSGTSARENWQFEIVNEALLPREYLMPDTVKIGRAVKLLKAEIKIPGVCIFDAGTVSFRS